MEVFDVIGFDNINTTADAQHNFVIDGTYDMGAWAFQAGVQNVADEEPPYVTEVSANTSGIYDFLGRFFVSVRPSPSRSRSRRD
jgi:iron complex outermembrane receptor protein